MEKDHANGGSTIEKLGPAVSLNKDVVNDQRKVNIDEKPYKCHNCFVVFPDVIELNLHMTTHSVKKSYECYYCPSDFMEENDLRHHTNSHTGGKS